MYQRDSRFIAYTEVDISQKSIKVPEADFLFAPNDFTPLNDGYPLTRKRQKLAEQAQKQHSQLLKTTILSKQAKMYNQHTVALSANGKYLAIVEPISQASNDPQVTKFNPISSMDVRPGHFVHPMELLEQRSDTSTTVVKVYRTKPFKLLHQIKSSQVVSVSFSQQAEFIAIGVASKSVVLKSPPEYMLHEHLENAVRKLIYGQIFHLSKAKGVTFVRNIFNSYSVNNSLQGVLAPTGFLPNCMMFVPTRSGTSTGIVTGLSNGSIVVDMPSINKRDLKLLDDDKCSKIKSRDQTSLSHISDYFDNQTADDVKNKMYYDPTNHRQEITKANIHRNNRPVQTPSIFQRFMGVRNQNPPAIRFELIGMQEGIHTLIEQTNRNLNQLERTNRINSILTSSDTVPNETETRVFRANSAAQLNSILVNEIRPILNDLVETTNRVLSQSQNLGANTLSGVDENTVRALDQIRNQIDMITGRQGFSQHTVGQVGQNLSAAPSMMRFL